MMTPKNREVRVRFAPSPTGYLHVGGARTALFNWLFAKQNDGDFLVRIEDTDIERSEKSMIGNILESLEWLSLSPDEPVTYQSNNMDAHKQAVRNLLGQDRAYRCFCHPDVLEEKRQKAESENQGYQYDGTCRNLSTEEIHSNLKQGKEYAIRFRVPEGWVNFKDRVYKKIAVNNKDIDEFIIQRRDGTPVYQLAVVVDDANMGITHVIRGEDHLSNTPKQILLYKALAYNVPRFAHLPLILGSDGKRLSKRHGAASVEDYRQKGYLYTALVNYLALLGWTPKSNEEIFMPEELIQQFDLLKVSKASATFDEKKLEWINGYHFSRWATSDLVPLVVPVLKNKGILDDDYNENYLFKVTDLLKSRVKTLYDFQDTGDYFWKEPREYDAKVAEKYWADDAVSDLMEQWLGQLKTIEDFNKNNLEKTLREFAEKAGVKAADIIHPTRLAITGTGVSPGIFEVMSLIGKERLIKRISTAIVKLPQ
jgi:glutamyl-tRNA synthetase